MLVLFGAGPRPAQYAEPPRHVGTQYEEPRSGDFAEKSGGVSTSPRGAASRHQSDRNGIYTGLRAAGYSDPPLSDVNDTTWCADTPATLTKTHQPDYDPRLTDYSDPRHVHEPRIGDFAEPRTVRYLERDFSDNEPQTADYAEPRSKSYSEDDEPRAADYAELQKYETQVKYSADDNTKEAEYAELQSMAVVSERSAADTEAAHELLSLAASVPPLPPATMLTVLSAPETVVPLYTYSFQPTNIYIIADEPANHNLYATAVQTLTPLQQVNFIFLPV